MVFSTFLIPMEVNNKINFNILYSTYYKKSFLFTKSYVHDDQAAEDIASESLIKLWEFMKNEDVVYPKVLLLKILKNKFLDYLKHQVIREEALNSINEFGMNDLEIRISSLETCIPDTLLSRELESLINEAIAKLPPQTRKIFEMSRFENKTNREIAETFHITTKGVEYHISNALKVMRMQLKDYLPVFYFLFYIN